MKKLKQFEKQPEETAVNLDVFLGLKPVEIDEAMYHYIVCAYNAPHYSAEVTDRHFVDQTSEANSSIKHDYDWEQYTYMTVAAYPDGTYWYLGILPDLNNEPKN